VFSWRGQVFVATPLVLASLLLILLAGPFDQGNSNSASLDKSSVVATVASPSGGSWSTDAQGDVWENGGANLYGSLTSQTLTAPIVDIAPTVDGKGYWLVASDGQIYCFGDAVFYGDTVVSGSRRLHHVDGAIVGMATTPDDTGYWEVASDGSIYAFGDARYFGPVKALHGHRAKPVVGMISTPDGDGYWEVASGGHLYPFGDAKIFNSTGEMDPALDGLAPALEDRAPVVHVSGNTLENASGSPLRLLGVDVSGTEDACVLDDGFSWGPLTVAEAMNIASWHTNVVRVPLNEDCWLGINGAPAAYSGLAYREMITDWVEDLNAAGLVVILDLHWSAPGDIEATEQWPMADANHSITFWTQVATTFKSMPSVIFDLFNEPILGKYSPRASDWSCWLKGCTTSFQCSTCTSAVTYQTAGMQQMLDAVRLTGATQPVLVGGTNWSGDPCGIKDYGGNGGVCMWLHYEPTDPDNEVIADFHTYDWTACATVSCWDTSVLPVAAKVPVISAEFGENNCSAAFDQKYMNWADQNDVSYLAWSWEVPAHGSTGCAATNLQLLSNLNGTPTVTSRAGVAVHAHLAHLAKQVAGSR
jgi:endoglucanase